MNNFAKSFGALKAVSWLVYLAAFFNAVSGLTSSFVSQNIITGNSDLLSAKLTAAMVYLTIGVLMQAVLALLSWRFAIGLQNKPTNKESLWSGGSGNMHLYAVLGALVSALALVPMLYVYQTSDSALVNSLLLTLPILFVFLIDVFAGKVTLSKVLVPASVVVAGAFLASVTSDKLSVGLLALGLLALASFLFGLNEEAEQKGTEKGDSPTKYSVWRMLYLGVFGVAASQAVVWYLGTWELFVKIVSATFWPAFWLVFVVQACGVLINFVKTWAKKDFSVTEVVLVLSVASAVNFVATYAIDYFKPNLLGALDYNPVIIVTRVVGVIMLVAGLTILARKVRAA